MKSCLFRLPLVLGVCVLTALAQEEKPQGAPNPSQQLSEAAVVQKLSDLQFHQGHDLPCLAGARETGDAKQGPSVSLVKWNPGCVIPWHWHTPNENVLVVEGVLQQEWRDRESAIAKHGDFIHIPSHQVNRAKCISETPCMILLYSDSPWDMHFVDTSGNEMSIEHTVAPAAKAMDGLMKPTEASSAEAELRAAMAERRRASLEGDTGAIERLTADEYIQTDVVGRVQDRSAWLAEYFRPLAALIKASKFRWEVYEEKDVQIRMLGDTAVVLGAMTLKGTGAKPAGHTWEASPQSSVGGTLRFTRVWISRNGRWLLAAVHNAGSLEQGSK